MPWNWICVFSQLALQVQDKVMVLPLVWSLVLYFYNTYQGYQHLQMHTTNHFSTKNKQEQDTNVQSVCFVNCISCLFDNDSFAATPDLWHGKGYRLLYETTQPVGPHYDVVPLERILGLCPVMRLSCNSNATIPEWVANSAEGAFPVGSKSTKTEPGSATYVI